jgi:hypothetical protein
MRLVIFLPLAGSLIRIDYNTSEEHFCSPMARIANLPFRIANCRLILNVRVVESKVQHKSQIALAGKESAKSKPLCARQENFCLLVLSIQNLKSNIENRFT